MAPRLQELLQATMGLIGLDRPIDQKCQPLNLMSSMSVASFVIELAALEPAKSWQHGRAFDPQSRSSWSEYALGRAPLP